MGAEAILDAGQQGLPKPQLADRVVVGLVQINNSFSGQNYLPYSVALLQTYVEKNAREPGRYQFQLPIL